MSLKLLLFFTRPSRTAFLSKFTELPPDWSLQRFKWSILSSLPPSDESRPAKWEMAVDTDLENVVLENAMTLEIPSGYASSLMLMYSPHFAHTLTYRLIRVLLPNRSNDSFVQLLKKVSVLERERAFITSGELRPDLILNESKNWPSVTAYVNEIDTRPLQLLDHLYQFCSIHEVCIDFAAYSPMSEMTSVMESILSAGLQSQVTIPAHSIYLRSLLFKPESLIFRTLKKSE